MSNQFGKRLFNTFFKSYTEKVWGMSCKDISADWAAQRIKGLSLGSAIKNALLPQRAAEGQDQGHQDADQFLQVSAQRPGHDVGSVRRKNQGDGRPDRDGLRRSPVVFTTSRAKPGSCAIRIAHGNVHTLEAEHVISSAPIARIGARIHPADFRERQRRPPTA